MTLVYFIIVTLLFSLIPDDLYAWGPGMHVESAMLALTKVAAIAPFIRDLIKRHPEAFIYGSASPDIIMGKKYAGYLHHCHNWRIGWLILHEAKTDRQRAAAYGYLTHLAADVVAHNYYIPVKIIRSFATRLLTHTYWEMRFDLEIKDEAWKRLDMVTNLEIEEFDELLKRVLSKTLLSFSTNKHIFNTILILQKMKSMRKTLSLYAKHSRFEIGIENRQHYLDLSTESVLEFLTHPEDAACMEVDPAGVKRIAYAKTLRSNLRALQKRGFLDKKKEIRFLDLVKESLAVGLYRPEMVLPDIVDIL